MINNKKKFNSILESVGNTPVVKLNYFGKEFDCDLYVKCEYFNPGGSVKDRIGIKMVEDAENSGRIKPGDTLIEPTSGNTGIGLALAAAVKGYKMIITMPQKMSKEKEVILKALGAEIIRTPTEVSWNDPKSHISVAKSLNKKIPNSHILDQYANPSNPNAHYYGTAKEILNQFGDELKMIVMGVGTGGTITGVAKKIKEEREDIKIIGADPYGSILGGGSQIKSYNVEGIGYDFFPEVLDNNLIDQYIKTDDKNSFQTARDLIKKEGLFVGGSCGAAVWAALQVAKELKQNEVCLIVLPDSVRNYMSKFVDDEWMEKQGFLD